MEFKDFNIDSLYIGDFKEFITYNGKCMFIGNIIYSPMNDNLHVPLVFKLDEMKSSEIKKQFGRQCITLFPYKIPNEIDTIESYVSIMLDKAVKSVVQRYFEVISDKSTLKIFAKIDHFTELFDNSENQMKRITIEEFNNTTDNIIIPYIQFTSIVKYVDEENEVINKLSIKLQKAIIIKRGESNIKEDNINQLM